MRPHFKLFTAQNIKLFQATFFSFLICFMMIAFVFDMVPSGIGEFFFAIVMAVLILIGLIRILIYTAGSRAMIKLDAFLYQMLIGIQKHVNLLFKKN